MTCLLQMVSLTSIFRHGPQLFICIQVSRQGPMDSSSIVLTSQALVLFSIPLPTQYHAHAELRVAFSLPERAGHCMPLLKTCTFMPEVCTSAPMNPCVLQAEFRCSCSTEVTQQAPADTCSPCSTSQFPLACCERVEHGSCAVQAQVPTFPGSWPSPPL